MNPTILVEQQFSELTTSTTEWVVGSAIAPCLTQKWLTSITNSDEIATLLNWKSYSHSGGWYVRSVNPTTGEYSKHGQFKPSVPLIVVACKNRTLGLQTGQFSACKNSLV